MSVRALLRAHADFVPVDLPSQSQPQHVNEDGFEYDPNEPQPGEEVQAGDEELEGGEEAEEVDQEIGGDEDVEVEAIEVEEAEREDEEDTNEPLLSIADSLVLPYSLTQTRLHHLTSLFPHIFSHPPIPSHSKPRARQPPKGTFHFPTPPPPMQPLPHPEYHGPTIPVESSTPGPGEPSKSQEPNDPSSISTSNPKSSRSARSKKTNDVEWPAHEIECISRCTLSVGPISFPETEIWIGRFVEPRVTQPKKERAKPGERKKRELLAAEEGGIVKKPRARKSGTEGHTPRPRLLAKSSTPISSPASTPNRPPPPPPARPPAYRPSPAASAQPARPPPVRPSGSAPTRPTTASPQLIQLVNQAATRHAWLSTLIYKAAGSTANQVELERLGKAVARLSRGEPIEDLAPPVPTAQAAAGPGPPTAAQAASSAATPATKPASATVPTAAPTTSSTASTSTPSAPAPWSENTPSAQSAPTIVQSATSSEPPVPVTANSTSKAEDSDSDDEVDMTGRPQVGGGPLPLSSELGTAKPPAVPNSNTSVTLPGPSSQTSQSNTSGPAVTPTTTASGTLVDPKSSASQSSTAAVTPTPVTPDLPNPALSAPRVSTADSNAQADQIPSATPTTTIRPPPIPPFAQPSPVERPTIATPPPPSPLLPPPPKPTYPLPPPFLLLAFKEQATEKFLLPLGQRSFISRVGGDYVTDPRPPTPEPEPVPQAISPPPPQTSTEGPKMETNVFTGSSTDAPAHLDTSAVINDVPSHSTLTESSAAPGKPLRSRTRQSLGRHAKEPTISTPSEPPKKPTPAPEPIPPTTQEPKSKPKPESGLPSLPGQIPPPGTVLLSTFILSGPSRWEKVDWEKLKERLPFDNPIFWDKPPEPLLEVKKENIEDATTTSVSTPVQPQSTRGLRHPRMNSDSTKKATQEKGKSVPDKPELLNLAVEEFKPSQGDLQPVTIRFMGITDEVWKKMKDIMEMAERHEIESMFRKEPGLLEGVVLDSIAENDKSSDLGRKQSIDPPGNHAPITPSNKPSSTFRGLSSKILSTLRPTYNSKKRSLFTNLLRRVPTRSFLTTRLPPPPPQELVEATSDKWAARPYPITTKPLYLPGGEDDDGEEQEHGREIEFSPPPASKKRKGAAGEEEKITFELPVSYDLLDERLEQGLKRDMLNPRNKRGRKSMNKSATERGEEEGKETKKRKNKRGTESGICEGCGREGIKVWRRGPGGRGTLCNACGDLFVAKQLPPLKRPGAMKALLGDGEDDNDDGDGDEKEVDQQQKEDGQNQMNGEGPDLKEITEKEMDRQPQPQDGSVTEHDKVPDGSAIDDSMNVNTTSTSDVDPSLPVSSQLALEPPTIVGKQGNEPALSENQPEPEPDTSSFKEPGITSIPLSHEGAMGIGLDKAQEQESGPSTSGRTFENGVDALVDDSEKKDGEDKMDSEV
ncbi:hypothetical protein L486_06853 [Kwoniella mangroviensis CBS 10435]|uniref:GATA-type domain-containing protein n=1 Tax=Kwoniella mangroviensis CBS 10435 TaxID=1331196 RepID=A0A1B9IJ09_9TREE|nr:hypothetical protein L486_06853 [Kwoniella mangroviensis CBS 10435]